jgi:hypothetical protein
MNEIIDFEVLAYIVVASTVLAKLFQVVKERIKFYYEKWDTEQREWFGYGVIVLSGLLMATTNLNAFPGFSRVWAWVGYVLTDVIAGFGPTLVYDMFIDKPQPPAPQITIMTTDSLEKQGELWDWLHEPPKSEN